jgi:hypothetical protein
MKVADRIQVFIDLDGVLADFLTHACARFGRTLNELPTGVYDLSRLFGMPWAEIDARIGRDYDFWRHVPMYPWTKNVITLLREAQTDGVIGDLFVLSSPWQQSPECHKAKLEWCDANLGIPTSDAILTPHKSLLAGPNRLLIDDLPSHCEEWCKRGGYAITFPCHHTKGRLQTFSVDPFIHLAIAMARINAVFNESKTRAHHVSRN